MLAYLGRKEDIVRGQAPVSYSLLLQVRKGGEKLLGQPGEGQGGGVSGGLDVVVEAVLIPLCHQYHPLYKK